jgi:hypothetical protein
MTIPSEPTDDRVFRSFRGGAIALASGATLVGAAMLEPDARGYGTHEQLGLFDACPAARSGAACPTCGLLTSVVHATRGEIADSLRTHGAGLPIVLVLAWAFVVGVAELLPKPWPSARVRRRVTLALALAFGIGATTTVIQRVWRSDALTGLDPSASH